MSPLMNLPDDIKQEFSVDRDGKVFASQSAIARLCGVTQQAIYKLLKLIATTTKPISESLEPFTGNDYTGTTKIPDLVVAAVIIHYAMYARKTTEQAKKVSLCFQAIGIRSWFQQQLGWQQEQPPSRGIPQQAIEIAARCLTDAGIDNNQAQSWKLDQYTKYSQGEEKLVFEEAKKLIASESELPSRPMSPTELGQIIGEKLGIDAVKPRKVNLLLIESGLQIAMTKTSKSSGKKKTVYDLTELGEKHGHREMTTARHSDGTLVTQIRWFISAVDVLADLIKKTKG